MLKTKEERMKILAEITQLEKEFCQDCEFRQNNSYCFTNCDVVNDLKTLGDQLIDISQEKQKSLLAKGRSMKHKDIIYLFNRGVSKKKLVETLGINRNAGAKIINDILEKGAIG